MKTKSKSDLGQTSGGFEPGHEEILLALERFRDRKVLVCGDLILDRFIDGEIERISPEAPIPVLKALKRSISLGGAGNVAANIAALGGTAFVVAPMGDDETSRTVERLLSDIGVEGDGLVKIPSHTTPAKTRFSAQNQQVLRFDEEEIIQLSEESRQQIGAAFERYLDRVDVVILSDYGKGALLDGMSEFFIKKCRQLEKPVIVDPKGRDFARYSGATAVSPNLKELGNAVDRPVTLDDEVIAAARQLIRDHKIDFILATRSEKGMSVVDENDVHHIPTRAREVFDVAGAGDTAVACFALSLASGLGREYSAFIANIASGIVVGKRGTAQATPEEIATALQADRWQNLHRAIASRKSAAQTVAKWKQEGLSVAFTNGCFDILHTGHVSLMRQAKATADRLVVGLNSDDSVRRLKGEGRPVNSESDRAAIIASLSDVDMVVIFDEDTPLSLIELICPDVLVKGADYTIENVVGADIVKAYGGKVVLAELVEGKSTSNILKQQAVRAANSG
jgi:D-beta-D-heptose 7-phosphate kinase/D-beta-D-heptose 1-phosphate adenosyltransferase